MHICVASDTQTKRIVRLEELGEPVSLLMHGRPTSYRFATQSCIFFSIGHTLFCFIYETRDKSSLKAGSFLEKKLETFVV